MKLSVYFYENNEADKYFLHRELNEGYQLTFIDEDSTLPTSPPDVFLVDVLLDRKTGFDIIRDIKKRKLLSKVPVILMSGEEPFLLREWKDYSKHIDAFMIKPITLTKINSFFEAYNDR